VGVVKKRARAAVAGAAAVRAPSAKKPPPPQAAVLSAADRENPEKLSGEALKQLAHRRGLARSSLEDMPELKIREQLRYLTHRQYGGG
jgi:hypothetical protein